MQLILEPILRLPCLNHSCLNPHPPPPFTFAFALYLPINRLAPKKSRSMIRQRRCFSGSARRWMAFKSASSPSTAPRQREQSAITTVATSHRLWLVSPLSSPHPTPFSPSLAVVRACTVCSCCSSSCSLRSRIKKQNHHTTCVCLCVCVCVSVCVPVSVSVSVCVC